MNQQDSHKQDLQPVFIVGMPRTGSKIYKNIINHHSTINISPEIFYLTPKWIREDFVSVSQSLIGELNNDQDLERLTSLMFQNKFFGTYWRDIKGEEKDMLALLKKTDKSYKEIFIAILKFDALANNKTQLGAKFPVHITKAHSLQKWFPSAKFVHINRHPLAIYNSQKRKHLKDKKGITKKLLMLTKVFLATIIAYRSSFSFNRINKNNNNYKLFEYEALTKSPEEQVKRLCEFLEIDYKPDMLLPPVKDSSYQLATASSGIHAASSTKWKQEVNFFEKIVFSIFTRKSFSVK